MALVPYDADGAVGFGNEGEGAGPEPQPLPLCSAEEAVGFQLPYKVATLKEGLNLRAYWNRDGGDEPEWLWARAHEYCKVGTHAGKFLSGNKAAILKDFGQFEVPREEFHYRQKAEQDERVKQNLWKEHTLDSRGLLVTLMWVTKNRALSMESKKQAIRLAWVECGLCGNNWDGH